LSRFSFQDKTLKQRRGAFCLIFHFGTKPSNSGAVLFVSFFISGQNPQAAARYFLSRFSFRDKTSSSSAVLFVSFFISGQNRSPSTALYNYYFITFGMA